MFHKTSQLAPTFIFAFGIYGCGGCVTPNASHGGEQKLGSTADSELRPPDDPFAANVDIYYLQRVHRVLLADAQPDRAIQMVTLPASGPEEVVFIIQSLPEDGGYRVEHVKATKSIAEHMLEDGGNIDVVRQQAPIDQKLAQRLKLLWSCASATARPARKPLAPPYRARVTLHGTKYYFHTFELGSGWRAMAAYSPAPASSADKLIAVSSLLVQYVNSPPTDRSRLEQQLETATESLFRELSLLAPTESSCANPISD
jgi:hypothetical protein